MLAGGTVPWIGGMAGAAGLTGPGCAGFAVPGVTTFGDAGFCGAVFGAVPGVTTFGDAVFGDAGVFGVTTLGCCGPVSDGEATPGGGGKGSL